jgi:uncharacterized protein
MIKTIKFVFITLSCFFAILYLLIVSYVYFNQEEMIFQYTKLPKAYKFDYKQKFEEITIASFDNVNLNGLLFKSKEASKGLIFYLHGNAGALNTWGNIVENYTNLGYDIFILDYRGFGKSEGEIESESQFNKDISVAYKSLCGKYNENKITVIGYSIGTGPATFLASNNSPKRLILQAPYYSFIELSNSRVPFIPDFLKKYKFETNIFITKVKVPIFIFHGNKDQIINYNNSQRLSKLLKKEDHFYILNGQDHIGINENQEYLEELKNILKN